jgi:hypothetical protein
MFLERFSRKVDVAIQYINDNWSPRGNITLLGLFVKEDKGADNVST